MVTRTVEVSRDPSHLCVRDGQMLVLRRDANRQPLPAAPPNLAGSIPLEDLGVLVVDERDTTYTHSLLAQMAEHGCALVVCGRDHHPAGMYLPLNTSTQLLARLDAQINAPRPRIKRLWQSVVAAKITAQAANLPPGPARTRLLTLSRGVKSGDPDNREGVAASVYWPALFEKAPLPSAFTRRGGEPAAPPPNGLLDYAYAALRATVARELVAAGLLPALGIKHIGRGNPFCLADDLMEPLRPIMDARVKYLVLAGNWTVNPESKAEVLKVLAETVLVRGERGPLMVQVARLVAAFVAVLTGDRDRLTPADFPILPHAANALRTAQGNATDSASTDPPQSVSDDDARGALPDEEDGEDR
ncbi:MAG: type II CRISPR-associated endonuclease Cas1 [Phycisphaerales bacterium]|nr:type II CRISPR-associated endonuclease Cas1 [Phycisphaerales bacterium]